MSRTERDNARQTAARDFVSEFAIPILGHLLEGLAERGRAVELVVALLLGDGVGATRGEGAGFEAGEDALHEILGLDALRVADAKGHRRV
jgi:hypothetical protein